MEACYRRALAPWSVYQVGYYHALSETNYMSRIWPCQAYYSVIPRTRSVAPESPRVHPLLPRAGPPAGGAVVRGEPHRRHGCTTTDENRYPRPTKGTHALCPYPAPAGLATRPPIHLTHTSPTPFPPTHHPRTIAGDLLVLLSSFPNVRPL